MAAHVYGRPLVSIEAFTHMKPHWSAWPASLKPGADAAFCDGVNRFVWHTCSASPRQFGKPGIVYFAGTHLNPNVTWFERAGPFLTYLARCQVMLRQGRFAADVCCYRSDRNYTTWARGTRRREPAFELPGGYAFDLINSEVLLRRLSVTQGGLVLPDGMQYRLLVFDPQEEAVPPEVLRKVVELAAEGATIVLGRRRPARAPGLKEHPACDEEVRRLVAELWGDAGDRPFRRSVRKGMIVGGAELEQVLSNQGVPPDCVAPWEFIHRRTDGLDVYFLAGQGEAECTFRVAGKEPELWDPLTGTVRDAVHWSRSDDGRTVVPLSLPENGSVFVVFRRPAQPGHLISAPTPQGGVEIAGRTDSGAEVRIWQGGRYALRTSEGRRADVDVALPEPTPLIGPWELRFAPGWGAPETARFDDLIPWNEHPDEGIKHFSGTATYRKAFTLDAAKAKGLVRLQLGDVRHVAEIRVNGEDLGVVWTAPWTVDLTGVVRPGENRLEIDVTNLWANRLIGDAGLPENRRLTKTNIYLETGDRTVRPYQGYGSNDPLIPSGLLGPVLLEYGRRRSVRF
jgi:hypothetical protein